MSPFRGVVVPVVTVFDAHGSIDWEASARVIDRLIVSGVDAVFVLGTTGEAQHLTPEEREQVIRWAPEAVAGRVPLFAGVGDTSTAVTERLLRASEAAGVDAVVAVGPYFWKLQERHLYAHFRSLSESTCLPVILYNYPDYVGADLSVDLVRHLTEDCPNIIGVKETLDSGTHMRQMAVHVKAVREDFAVFCGHDDLALFALTAGLDGVVSSTVNFAPEAMVGLWRSYRNGEFEDAQALSCRIGRLVEAYRADPCGAAVVKAAMHLRGWIENPAPRPPALPLTEEGIRQIERLLCEMGLLSVLGGKIQP